MDFCVEGKGVWWLPDIGSTPTWDFSKSPVRGRWNGDWVPQGKGALSLIPKMTEAPLACLQHGTVKDQMQTRGVWSSLGGSTVSLPRSVGGAPARCWSCQREGLGRGLLAEWDAGRGKTCSWSHAMSQVGPSSGGGC